LILYRFNHKTGAEDVHFTSALALDESDESAESITDHENDCNDLVQTQTFQPQENVSFTKPDGKGSSDGPNSECSDDMTGNPMELEMILVKDVKAGIEVHTSCLSHRYLLLVQYMMYLSTENVFTYIASLCFISRTF